MKNMAVKCMYDQFHFAGTGGQPADGTRFRGMGMNNVGLLAPKELLKPDKCENVFDRAHFSNQPAIPLALQARNPVRPVHEQTFRSGD